MNRKLRILIALAGGLVAALPCAANIIVNGSFENPVSLGFLETPFPGFLELQPGSVALPGWTVVTSEIAQLYPSCGCGIFASDGGYSLDLTGIRTALGGVRQTISTVTGATYSISFDVGATPDDGQVRVTAGSLTALQTSVGAGSSVHWTTYNGVFTALSASTDVTLQGTIGSGATSQYLGLDNVIVNLNQLPAGTTPEPGTFFLLAGAMLVIVKRRLEASV